MSLLGQWIEDGIKQLILALESQWGNHSYSDPCAEILVCGHIESWQEDVNVDIRISDALVASKCFIFQCSIYSWRMLSCLGSVKKFIKDVITK